MSELADNVALLCRIRTYFQWCKSYGCCPRMIYQVLRIHQRERIDVRHTELTTRFARKRMYSTKPLSGLCQAGTVGTTYYGLENASTLLWVLLSHPCPCGQPSILTPNTLWPTWSSFGLNTMNMVHSFNPLLLAMGPYCYYYYITHFSCLTARCV